jgi:hypothetical protein
MRDQKVHHIWRNPMPFDDDAIENARAAALDKAAKAAAETERMTTERLSILSEREKQHAILCVKSWLEHMALDPVDVVIAITDCTPAHYEQVTYNMAKDGYGGAAHVPTSISMTWTAEGHEFKGIAADRGGGTGLINAYMRIIPNGRESYWTAANTKVQIGEALLRERQLLAEQADQDP